MIPGISSHKNRQGNLLLTLQTALGVERQGSILEWCLRLLLLPPRDARAAFQPSPESLWLHVLLEQFRIGLGLQSGDRWPQWMLGLFLLPASQRHTHTGWSAYYLAAISRKIQHWLDSWSSDAITQTIWLQSPFVMISGLFALALAMMPLDIHGQLIFFLLTYAVAILFRPVRHGIANLFLIVLSLMVIFRYAFWRSLHTLDVDGIGNNIYASSLFLAEGFSLMVTALSFLQCMQPLQRPSSPLPSDSSCWPDVDIYIPTYNEPLDIVRLTVLAAQGLDWPQERLHVYLLDDGRREHFRSFAREAGVGYITREDNLHAKAGNLNHALQQTQAAFIAVFDCDHIPVRSFLQTTLGCMLADPKLALVQTPHHFFSPDPFERNLGTFRTIPNEGYLFNRMVQDGNDLWNAAFFCGSCAVLRRQPLEAIGGIAVETVTEDAHTALKLHRQGWHSAYINQPQAAGLATESLASHIGQRIRWARGMAQIFRIDNPLSGKGLNFFQRLCYTNASMHFFFGLPRLVFLTAPMGYLFFDLHFINADPLLLLMYGFPYLAFANLTNNKIQGQYRHAFWAEVYETILAAYIAIPTALALINPGIGQFNVTPKGGIIPKSFLDWRIATPFMIILALNATGFGLGVYRLLWTEHPESQVLLMNLFWTLYNLVVLGVVFGIATESRRLRKSPRVTASLKAVIDLEDGRSIPCQTLSFSSEDLVLGYPAADSIAVTSLLGIRLYDTHDQTHYFTGHVLAAMNGRISIQLLFSSLEEEQRYILCTHARPDAWYDWLPAMLPTSVLASIATIIMHSGQGYRRLGHHLLRPLAAYRRS
ncbi:MAG: UDP-forming cellulose synthase catalytic subunit [Pseudomonadota bacterium]|jgi:cellulose synthase (UDP-forming)